MFWTQPGKRAYFQFEMRCASNHTACRFAEKARFFRKTTGRAALCRRLVFYLSQRQNALAQDKLRPRLLPPTHSNTGMMSRQAHASAKASFLKNMIKILFFLKNGVLYDIEYAVFTFIKMHKFSK